MEGIDLLMRHIYLFPVVGTVLGIIFGLSAFLLLQIFPMPIVAALLLIIIYKLCGINHLDGLADFGDGVTAHGPVEKKISAMKDTALGTGGALFIMILLFLVFATLSSMPERLMPLALVVAEVSAKQSMIAFAAFSKPLHKGFGQIAIENASGHDFFAGFLIALPICAAVLGAAGLAMLIAAQLSALYMIALSKRNFGGSTGDGFGATNEIGRAVALIVSLMLWEVNPWMPW